MSKLKFKTRELILVSLFSALMIAGAYIKIPFPFLPLTLQPFFCAFAGLLLGARLGALSQGIYIVLGLAGLPVFAQGSGISYVLSPTFGFLIGFIAGAYVIGKIFEKLGAVTYLKYLLSVMSGFIAIYFIGIVYMFFIMKFYLHNEKAAIGLIIAGNLPYMIKDLVLYIIVAFIVNSVHPVLKKAGLV